MAGYASLLVLALFALTFQLSSQNDSRGKGNYRAMITEYLPDSDTTSNILDYTAIIVNSKLAFDIDLLVFPEVSLTVGQNSAECVPDPKDNIVPYKDSRYENSEAIRAMSKAAADYRLYLVVNVAEKSDCSSNDNRNSVAYNTNVVFDRKGTVIAKYRKFNVYNQLTEKKPEEAECVTFTTDFGVTFGLFTGFDVLFQQPALELVKKHNVENIIFSSRWFGELPFLTSAQVQSGWSYSNNVTLFASGTNDPATGSSGSGIFFGRQTKENWMYEKYGSSSFWSEISTKKSGFVQARQSPQMRNGLLLLADPSIPSATVKELDLNKGNFVDTVTNNGLTCKFEIKYRKGIYENIDGYKYKVVAFQGKRLFGGVFTLDVEYCSVVLCKGDVCTSKPENSKYPLVFEDIKIEAEFNSKDSFQFPTTLKWTEDEDMVNILNTLDYNQFRFDTESVSDEATKVTMKLTGNNVNNLITFGIYGRNFTPE